MNIRSFIDNMRRKCIVCKRKRLLCKFYKDKTRKYGHAYTCKECAKRRYWENRDKNVINMRRRYKRNQELWTWRRIKDRCYNKKNKDYKHYGGRGIKMCKQWFNDFNIFLRDMGSRPRKMTIERIDNNGNYCLDNCRWATQGEQTRNTRRNVKIRVGDREKILIEWAEELKMSPSGIRNRKVRHGLSWEKAVEFYITRLDVNSGVCRIQ